MRIAGDALLLGTTNVHAPAKGVISARFCPVVDPLQMVFGLFQRTVALIDPQSVSKVESSASADVERRHATGFHGSQIESREASIAGGRGAYAIGLHANTVAIESDRKSTRLNSSHRCISYAVFCLK